MGDYVFGYKPWKIEMFNGWLNGPDKPRDSMLLGLRAMITPVANLNLEFIKMSQWGGEGYYNGLKGLSSAIISNSNEGEYASVNQFAGFGIKYKFSLENYPVFWYLQAMGEDEAGGLPSCYSYLSGVHVDNMTQLGAKGKIGIEFIDTTVDKTENGNCGPNTAYNNRVYKYTHEGAVLGVPIDSEARSVVMYAQSSFNDQVAMRYSLGYQVINDQNSAINRLSPERVDGVVASVAFDWDNRAYKSSISIDYQNYDLDQIDSESGIAIKGILSIKL
jgi:hypothetical protein